MVVCELLVLLLALRLDGVQLSLCQLVVRWSCTQSVGAHCAFGMVVRLRKLS